MGRIDKTSYYLNIAKSVAQRSTCLKRRYGCIIVNNDIIIATGYNGSPRGEDNCCDIGECKRKNAKMGEGYDLCPAVHAEQNAMLSVSKLQMIGATLYLSCEEYVSGNVWKEYLSPLPCNMCLKQIKNSGIVKVVNKDGVLWEA